MELKLQENDSPRKPGTISTMINISDLHVSFPVFNAASVSALRGINLDINHGEIIGVVGESGSGKTTLARSIMGLLPSPGRIDSGKVMFQGQNLTELGEEEMRCIRGRDLAMIIPNPRGELNPLLRVGEQISTLARVHLGCSKSEAQNMALEMLQIVNIPDPKRRFNAYPHELSGGMAQRVVMAISLVCSPKLIIADDATSGLDVTVQAQVLDHMNRLVRQNNTSMLFITRDIGITAHYCDRITIIYAGQLLEMGERYEFFDNPMHPYSIMLMAAFSHNPKLREKWTRSEYVAGQILSTNGCSFANRCVRAHEKCRRITPVLEEVTKGHLVRCLYPVMR